MTLSVYAQAFAAADQAVGRSERRSTACQISPSKTTATWDNQAVWRSSLALVPIGRLADFCRRNGIRRLAVFGSALRHDFTPDSDVDLLVEFEPGQVPGMFRISGMELELEQKVFHGRRVDLRTAAELGQRFRDRVVAEAAPVYDAAA